MQMNVLERARNVLLVESDAIRHIAERLDDRVPKVVDMLLQCPGRVVTTGVGKAGAIARKLAATFASTGTPALFMHPAEAVHGDLGMVTSDDIVLAFSYSGESDEVVRLIPVIKLIGASLVAVCGNPGSSLGAAADVALDVHVDAEACPLGLAPTTSTTAMLALGDAIAMATMEARGFRKQDFAVYHPAGALGRRLTLRVGDVMRTGENLPICPTTMSLRDVLFAITRARAGASILVDANGVMTGIVTDGDVRRALLHDTEALNRPVEAFMTRNPLAICGNPLAAEALQMLQDSPRQPGEAPVVDTDGRPVGLIMLKDLLRTGIV